MQTNQKINRTRISRIQRNFWNNLEGDMKTLIHSELTYRIRSALFTVHRNLGTGFREEAYRRACLIELEGLGLSCETEKEIPVCYRNRQIDIYRIDLVVDKTVVLELKAADELHPRHEAQLLSYLRASGLPVGLLVNFGEPSLRIVRRVNQKSVQSVNLPRNPRTGS
jgi:GxxExxY protein